MSKPEQTPSAPTEPKSEMPKIPKDWKSIGKFQRKSDGRIYDMYVHAPTPPFFRTHTGYNESDRGFWEADFTRFIEDFNNEDGTSLHGNEKWQ